jgi:energy-coupling factor transporter transmembrane protein EcfT
MHPILKMGVCILVTALSFPSWDPLRLSGICAVLMILQLADYRPNVWKRFASAWAISGVLFGISYLLSRDLSGAACSGLHFTVLLLAAFYMFQTEPSELLRGLQSYGIPDQLLLGFLVMYRFIHVLREELSDIWQANTMIDTRRIGFLRKSYRCLMVPFSYRLLTLSDQLSLSIMSRDFGCGKRSQFRDVKMSFGNAVGALFSGALCVVILWFPLT